MMFRLTAVLLLSSISLSGTFLLRRRPRIATANNRVRRVSAVSCYAIVGISGSSTTFPVDKTANEMMFRLTAVLLLSSISLSGTFLLRRRPRIATANNRAIDPMCLDLAEQGSCDFYECFERRLPCGRNWYIARTGQYYCDKIQTEAPNFSYQGQQFLNDTQACLTRSLKAMYQRDYVICQELENEAMSAIVPCYVDNAFCDIYEVDSSHFFDVFETTDLFTVGASRVWRMIASLAARCGAETLRELSSDTGETVIDAINSLLHSLGDLFDK